MDRKVLEREVLESNEHLAEKAGVVTRALEKLRPVERLRRAGDFQQVFKSGRCFRTPFLRVHFRNSRRELSRLGLVVTRRMGKAVVRNRVKRLLREVYRRNKGYLSRSMDVVLVPQGGARSYRDYLEAFRLFAKALGKCPPAGRA